jgi:hypothetical protein
MFKKLIDLFKRDSLPKLIKKADRLANKNKVQYLILPVDKNGQLAVVPGYRFLEEYNSKAKKLGIIKLSYPKLLKIAKYKTAL